MVTLIVLGIAATVIGLLFVSVVAPNARRRENRFVASGDPGIVPWIDAGGAGSGCDAGTSSDAGCGDGGGGGGGD